MTRYSWVASPFIRTKQPFSLTIWMFSLAVMRNEQIMLAWKLKCSQFRRNDTKVWCFRVGQLLWVFRCGLRNIRQENKYIYMSITTSATPCFRYTKMLIHCEKTPPFSRPHKGSCLEQHTSTYEQHTRMSSHVYSNVTLMYSYVSSYVTRTYSHVAPMYSDVTLMYDTRMYTYISVYYTYVIVWCFSHDPTRDPDHSNALLKVFVFLALKENEAIFFLTLAFFQWKRFWINSSRTSQTYNCFIEWPPSVQLCGFSGVYLDSFPFAPVFWPFWDRDFMYVSC